MRRRSTTIRDVDRTHFRRRPRGQVSAQAVAPMSPDPGPESSAEGLVQGTAHRPVRVRHRPGPSRAARVMVAAAITTVEALRPAVVVFTAAVDLLPGVAVVGSMVAAAARHRAAVVAAARTAVAEVAAAEAEATNNRRPSP